jgi:hypothetical protein
MQRSKFRCVKAQISCFDAMAFFDKFFEFGRIVPLKKLIPFCS